MARAHVPLRRAPHAGFSAGEYVFATGGSWNYDTLAVGFPDLAGKWSSAPLPAGPATLVVKPSTKANAAVMDLRRVVLRPTTSIRRRIVAPPSSTPGR